MSGAETISALRRLQPDVRVLVASGYASEEATADCMRRGAADCIRKPFDLDELMIHVRALAR